MKLKYCRQWIHHPMNSVSCKLMIFMKRWIISRFFNRLILIGLFLLFVSLPRAIASNVIENDYLKYEIANDCRNLHFIDKATGIDYFFTDSASYCAYTVAKGKKLAATSVLLRKDILFLKFGKSGITAEIRITKASSAWKGIYTFSG